MVYFSAFECTSTSALFVERSTEIMTKIKFLGKQNLIVRFLCRK